MTAALLDTRSEIKVPNFDGRDEHWPEWSVKFESYALLLGWGDRLTEAEQRTEPITAESLANDEGRRIDSQLWALLVAKTAGKAFAIVRLRRGRGLECWRQLKLEYEAKVGGRWAVMLRGILVPGASWERDRA